MVVKSEDVARAAGVSRATVSQILNGRGQRFSDETRDRVLRLASEMEYRPSIAARALATGSSDIIVALLPFTQLGGNLQAVLERATDEFADAGLTLVLRLSTQTAKPLAQVLESLRPRAVFSLGHLTDEERRLLEEHDILGIGPSTQDEIDFGFDTRIGRVQAQHLHERGFDRLAYAHLDDERFQLWGPSRRGGFTAYASENGLPLPLTFECRLTADDALHLVDALPPHTGVACYNDDLAITLMSAAIARGRAVPADLGFIGMDDTPLSATIHPTLSTLSIDVRAAAENVIHSVLVSLGVKAGEPPRRSMQPRVLQRQSS
jgi:DNA-binding LacI/PurR family transcriptional regulator